METAVILTNEAGLHARPAALFVQTAAKFKSAITVRCGEKKGNAKSMLSLLALGAKQGAEVSISADGPDAAAAVETLVTLVRSGLEG
ncbi:MAG TPA: HPr family phosphocarrier protein [Symbiobacteriaceae bacterium]|nr:HPr family phosphocarrier protein [Symbiobacteriaceae bacterium]